MNSEKVICVYQGITRVIEIWNYCNKERLEDKDLKVWNRSSKEEKIWIQFLTWRICLKLPLPLFLFYIIHNYNVDINYWILTKHHMFFHIFIIPITPKIIITTKIMPATNVYWVVDPTIIPRNAKPSPTVINLYSQILRIRVNFSAKNYKFISIVYIYKQFLINNSYRDYLKQVKWFYEIYDCGYNCTDIEGYYAIIQ